MTDVILCLLHSDPTSYVHANSWKPTLGAHAPNDFRMTDLIEFAT